MTFDDTITIEFIQEGESFVAHAASVARALGYVDPGQAIRDHVPVVERLKRPITVQTGNRFKRFEKRFLVPFLTEAGVYRLIMASKMSIAERFKTWVTRDALPALRRDGTYTVPEPQAEIPAVPAPGGMGAMIERAFTLAMKEHDALMLREFQALHAHVPLVERPKRSVAIQ